MFYAGVHPVGKVAARPRRGDASSDGGDTTITAAAASRSPSPPANRCCRQSASGWLILVGLAWISHARGQGLIAYALAHLPAAFSSVSLLFQPVMAAFFAWLLLAEPLAPLQIAGGVVVLAGIYLARRGSQLDDHAFRLAAGVRFDDADLVDSSPSRFRSMVAHLRLVAARRRSPCRCRS